MSLIYKTSKWCQQMWKNHVDHSRSTRVILQAGMRKQPRFQSFADDVHADLYLRHDPEKANDPYSEWATSLRETAKSLSQWNTLRQRCALNGFVAGVATEAILNAILAHVPDPPTPPPPKPSGGQGQLSYTHAKYEAKCSNVLIELFLDKEL